MSKKKHQKKNAVSEPKRKEKPELLPRSGAATAGGAVLFLVIVMGITLLLTFVATGSPTTGHVFSLGAAVVLTLCWYRKRAGLGTLVIIAVVLAACIALFCSIFINGAFLAFHSGAIEAFEGEHGLSAIGLSTGNNIIDSLRTYAIHGCFSTQYSLPLNLTIFGIFFILLSAGLYIYLVRFMVKRIR